MPPYRRKCSAAATAFIAALETIPLLWRIRSTVPTDTPFWLNPSAGYTRCTMCMQIVEKYVLAVKTSFGGYSVTYFRCQCGRSLHKVIVHYADFLMPVRYDRTVCPNLQMCPRGQLFPVGKTGQTDPLSFERRDVSRRIIAFERTDIRQMIILTTDQKENSAS